MFVASSQRLTPMQRILVCAQDPVLAKKVRFLMERDECKVDILSSPESLERRLEEESPTLLVLSRTLSGEDAIDLVARLDPSLDLPPTLVLGGQPRIAAGFIHLVPDPVDTQAIYREASRLLQAERREESDVETPASGPETDTAPFTEESQPISDRHALEGIANQLKALDEDDFDEQLSDAFELDQADSEVTEVKEAALRTETAAPVLEPPPPGDTFPLEPAGLARALHQAWSEASGGAWVVDAEDQRITIYFEGGRPVHVGSSVPGDPLGPALVSRGRLSDGQYASAAKRAIENGTRLADAILALGYLSDAELGAELGTSARELLVSCFARTRGRFWFDDGASAPRGERPYRLEVGHIVALGLRTHADAAILDEVLGDRLSGYFKLRRPVYELQKDFPLSKADSDFLAFEGRAYNVEDAADVAGLDVADARTLLAILAVTDEVEPFTPTAQEFEDRIREERATRRELESQMPRPASVPPGTTDDVDPGATAEGEPLVPRRLEGAPSLPPPAPPPGESYGGGAPPPAPPPIPGGRLAGNGARPPGPTDTDIPPMPTPPAGEGVAPRPLAYAKPLPRGPDGSMLETPERNLSREHFQRGVGLLGKGNFSSAEESFRDAVALCSEEHVYLIGLARAIYYNPSYRADGKLPVLRSIVDRAHQLAPDDKRVATLEVWVEHAEASAAPS